MSRVQNSTSGSEKKLRELSSNGGNELTLSVKFNDDHNNNQIEYPKIKPKQVQNNLGSSENMLKEFSSRNKGKRVDVMMN